MLTDKPIEHAEDDILNRSAFAGNLADALLNQKFGSSFAVGLYGKWGSGKTSLLNMVLERIADVNDDKIVVLRFNPWLYSDSEQLISQFFKQLGSAIKLKGDNNLNACKLIEEYSGILHLVKYLPFGNVFDAGSDLLEKKAKEVIENSHDLQAQKDKIVNALVKERWRIFVAIDDIDRLSDEEIISVFQLIKSLADFPNATYILAFDYYVVVKALETVQHGNGREYLEKIIQVPFEIPAPNIGCIHEALFDQLNQIIQGANEEDFDKDAWIQLFRYGIKSYIRTLRDVTRYSNVFGLKYSLLKNETDLVDLLGITCLQVFEPFLFTELSCYKEDLCGESLLYSGYNQKSAENKLKKVLESLLLDSNLAINNKNSVKNILAILFPRVADILQDTEVNSIYYKNEYNVRNKVAAFSCFDRYFTLMLEEEAISNEEAKRLILYANENEVIVGLKMIYQKGKIKRMFDMIENYAKSSKKKIIMDDRAEILIRSLMIVYGEFKVEDRDIFEIPFSWRFIACILALLKHIDTQNRLAVVKKCFVDERVHVSTLAITLKEFEIEHNRYFEANNRTKTTYIELSDLIVLEEEFIKRSKSALESHQILQQQNGLESIRMLEKLDPEYTVTKKRDIVTDNNTLIEIICYFVTHGHASNGFTSYKTWTVYLAEIEEYILLEEAYKKVVDIVRDCKCDRVDANSLNDLIAFLIAYEDGIDSENHISESSIMERLKKIAI